MALLNPPDVLPEAMRFLLRALLAAPGRSLPQSTLIATVAPEGLAEAMKAVAAEEAADDGEAKTGGRLIAQTSLAALGQLGLVTFDGSGADRQVAVSTRFTGEFSAWDAVTGPAFAAFLRHYCFTPEVSDAPMGSQETGSADLAQGIALLHLAPRPLQPFSGFETGDRTFQQLEYDLLPSKDCWPVGNPLGYPPFVRWATYLGLATLVPAGRGRTGTVLVADASAAVEEHIAELVPKLMPIGDVVAAVGERFPALDGGRVHQQVREALTQVYPAGQVSPGLALTLRTLEHRGHVRLSLLSDAAVLQFPWNDRLQPFSHAGPPEEG